MYLRKNNQGLSAAHLQQESRPVMKSLISASLLYLLRYISHYILHFSPSVFFPILFFMGFLKKEFSLNPLSCVPSLVLFHQRPVGGAHAQRAAILRLTAENREESLWVVVTFGERCIFASLAHSFVPPTPSSPPPTSGRCGSATAVN